MREVIRLFLFTSLAFLASAHHAVADDLGHLPVSVSASIQEWRETITGAKCLKVVCETRETWQKYDELGSTGGPRVAREERFQVHAWMTRDDIWLSVFAFEGDGYNLEHPLTQAYWNRRTGRVLERFRLTDEAGYHARQFEADTPFGPGSITVSGSRGCIWATVIQTWLAEEGDDERPTSAESMLLLRPVHLAVIPPDHDEGGIWFDVFRDAVVRDRKAEESAVYRRNDLMLLAASDGGSPEVREWRTIVLTDPDSGGRDPTQIVGSRRFQYTVYDERPTELVSLKDTFCRYFDPIADDEPTGQLTD